LIEQGFTSAPTQYRLYGRRFLLEYESYNDSYCQCENCLILYTRGDEGQEMLIWIEAFT